VFLKEKAVAYKGLTSISRLASESGIKASIIRRHINILKEEGTIPKKFATLRSDRILKFLEAVAAGGSNVLEIGKSLGYENPNGLIYMLRKRGYGEYFENMAPTTPAAPETPKTEPIF
jgi:hypothetical protein